MHSVSRVSYTPGYTLCLVCLGGSYQVNLPTNGMDFEYGESIKYH